MNLMKRMKLWEQITRIENIARKIETQQLNKTKVLPMHLESSRTYNHMQKDGLIRKFDIEQLTKSLDNLQAIVSREDWEWVKRAECLEYNMPIKRDYLRKLL